MLKPVATPEAKLVAVDWGTTNLRARLVDGSGAVMDEHKSDQGIGVLNGSGHEAAFEAAVAGWPVVPAVMTGMIGSRQGWREAPYVPCPANADKLATAMMRFTTASGRPVAIAPGLMMTSGEGNVMRGEETQIIGVLDAEPGFNGTCIAPGTHSKWARVSGGTIGGFDSFISGELFDLLAHRSLLRHSVSEPNGDVAALPDFRAGVERVTTDGAPFLSTIFSVRVRQLLGSANPQDNYAYLSGLVIGGEVAAAIQLRAITGTTALRIIATGPLARAYRKALEIAGYDATILDGDRMAMAGLLHLARVVGFLPKAA
jgi:2-dehydro-3-deoxygalactonokinase